MPDSQRIVVVGFMGAGKTTVARELARLLNDSVIDLDDSITKIEGRTPRQLIDEEGEESFRAAETRALLTALDYGTAHIISLGGGAWTVEANRTLVARAGCLSVWLDAPFDLCWRRIARANDRPFARDRERALSLYKARRTLYALADLHVVAVGKSAARVAAEIEKLLRPVQDVVQTKESSEQGGTEKG